MKSSLTKAASAIQSACEKVGHKDDSEMSEEEKLLFRRKHLLAAGFQPNTSPECLGLVASSGHVNLRLLDMELEAWTPGRVEVGRCEN